MSQAISIEILTKKDCCLCEPVKETVRRVARDYPVQLRLTDIETDPALFEQYKEKIPVVKINGEDSFVYKVHEVTLRARLDEILQGKD